MRRALNCTLDGFSQLGVKLLLASPSLSVRMEQLGCHLTDFHEIWYLRIVRKSVEKIQVSLKYDKNNGAVLYLKTSSYYFLLWLYNSLCSFGLLNRLLPSSSILDKGLPIWHF
jgi:hypothetical protein